MSEGKVCRGGGGGDGVEESNPGRRNSMFVDPTLARHSFLGTKCLVQWLPSHKKKL